MALLIFGAFWTLPMGILIALVLSERFGARAGLWLSFPFPVLVVHVAHYQRDGMSALADSARFSMGTVPMALTWGLCYVWLSRWIAPRVASRPLQAALTMFGATVASAVLLRAIDPVWTAVIATAPGMILGLLAVVGAAAWALRPSPDEREPIEVHFGPVGVVASAATVLGVLILLGLTDGAAGPLALVHLFLSSFPRMTFEVAVAHHVTAGGGAARQALSSLPMPVAVICMWSVPFALLGGVLPDATLWALGLGGAVALWLGWIALYIRWWPHQVFRTEPAEEPALTPVPARRS